MYSSRNGILIFVINFYFQTKVFHQSQVTRTLAYFLKSISEIIIG